MADLKQDEQLYDSVLMNLIVIGEQASHINDVFKEKHAKIPWHQIIGMRNLISHDYFSIKTKVVWDTIKTDLPALRKQLTALL